MNPEAQLSQDLTAAYSTATDDDGLREVWTELEVELGTATHQGRVRSNNEDHYLVTRSRHSLENLSTNLDERVLQNDFSLIAHGILVADGIGGIAAGEASNEPALMKLAQLLVDMSEWIMGLERTENISAVLQRITDRFLQIDEALKEKAKWDITLRGSGTTLTVACTLGANLVIGHVGDSRAYLLRDTQLTQLTTDHTLSQSLIDAGIADRDDPAPRSMRHVLTAALGSLGKPIEPQVLHLKVYPGDQLLLCTDGLTKMLEDKAIARVMGETNSALRACEMLIDLTLAEGGFDNVTVAIQRFGPPSPAPNTQIQETT